MEIPLSLEINVLNDFAICFFKDKTHSKKSPSHYYITIPTTSNSYLIICLISSQWGKRAEYYKKSNPDCLNSLIILKETELDFLRTQSVIDCNDVTYMHKNELQNKIVPNTYKFVSDDISDELKEKIIKAIKLSPKVKPYIKEKISKNHLTND